jgi:hypothetical protein
VILVATKNGRTTNFFFTLSFVAVFGSELRDPGRTKIRIRNTGFFFTFLRYGTFPGHWSAWLVDEEGVKRSWGIIPSKYKVEEELLLKRPLGEFQLLTIEFP